jgi:ABC-type transporter MlaC component
MILLRGFLGLIFVFTLALSTAPSAQAADVELAKKTVSSAVADALGSFEGTNHPPEERARLLDSLIRHYADPTQLSATILGRYWSRYTPEEQSQFAEMLVRYLVANYSVSLVDIPVGNHIELNAAEDLGDRVLVHSTAYAPAQPPMPPTPVDWEVSSTPDGRPVVTNLLVQGVSLIKAMRDDFNSVLRSNGGKLQPLMDALQQKIDSPK